MSWLAGSVAIFARTSARSLNGSFECADTFSVVTVNCLSRISWAMYAHIVWWGRFSKCLVKLKGECWSLAMTSTTTLESVKKCEMECAGSWVSICNIAASSALVEEGDELGILRHASANMRLSSESCNHPKPN